MTDESHVDGNALGGLFHEVFGQEMTDQSACCANCGAVGQLATLLVFRRAPGVVARCPSCGTVLLVAVERGDALRLSFEALRWLELRRGHA